VRSGVGDALMDLILARIRIGDDIRERNTAPHPDALASCSEII